MKRLIRATALVLAALSAPPRYARADPPAPASPTGAELATARHLFGEALAAEDRGRCVDAIPVYERIARIAVSPVLYLRLGTCTPGCPAIPPQPGSTPYAPGPFPLELTRTDPLPFVSARPPL